MHRLWWTILIAIVIASLSRAQTDGDLPHSTHTLIYIDATTYTLIAYDPHTDAHTPLIACPAACYDPATDQRGRIAVVTDGGFAIFDGASGDFITHAVDFGVYGYKGGAAFRPDLAYVAYDARFDMHMRLMLTDLTTGITRDVFSAGVGNPAWTPDGTALVISDGTTVWRVPIDGGDPTALDIPHPSNYIDLVTPFGDGWAYRGRDETGYAVYIATLARATPLIHAPAIMTYATSDTHIASVTYDLTTYRYAIVIADATTPPITIPDRRDITTIALSPDGRYAAWLEEHPQLGFGFYDLWLVDRSASSVEPVRIAEGITAPNTRPSRLLWMRRAAG